MSKQQPEEHQLNSVTVCLRTELDCNPEDGEYSLVITGFTGFLDISSEGGIDDVSLVKEAIENDLIFKALPEEGCTEIVLSESGEWEDVFWHKYYKIERVSSLKS